MITTLAIELDDLAREIKTLLNWNLTVPFQTRTRFLIVSPPQKLPWETELTKILNDDPRLTRELVSQKAFMKQARPDLFTRWFKNREDKP